MARAKKAEKEELEAFSARLTPRAKHRLDALAKVKKTAAYLLLEEAFWTHWEALPEPERRAAETIASVLEGVG